MKKHLTINLGGIKEGDFTFVMGFPGRNWRYMISDEVRSEEHTCRGDSLTSINNYSFKYKISVVELYLSSDLSYQELALKEGINSPALIGKWVNAFQIAGPDALRPRMKGRKKTLDNIKKGVTDTSVEHVKELEDELLKLKIENAFLKELRRLRLEDEVTCNSSFCMIR